jgi:phospholipase C
MSLPRRLLSLAAVVGLAWPALLGVDLAGTSAANGLPPVSGTTRAVAATTSIRHIVVVVMENKSYGSIVGSTAAPYLNSLIRRYGLATNYTGVAHPSLPNYLALFSGSTQGVRDDGVHTFSGKTLADQLEAHGRTWRVVAENVPPGCYAGAVSYGGADGPGWYARKHEPAISFSGIRRSPKRCANVIDLRHFSLAAANYQLVVPNSCHDMHDCSIAVGDAFLKGFFGGIVKSPEFASSLVVITFDEGTDSAGGGGRVATVLVGPGVRSGYRSAIAYDHYSLLRTIENLWGLGCLNRSCSANDLGEFLR